MDVQAGAGNAAWHGMFCIEKNLVEGKGQEAWGVIRKERATDLGDVAAASSRSDAINGRSTGRKEAWIEGPVVRCVWNLCRAPIH
jgi:hypothetical protein